MSDAREDNEIWEQGVEHGYALGISRGAEMLLRLRRHDMPDGPCWCSVEPNKSNGYTHEKQCREVRALIKKHGIIFEEPVR